MPRYATRVSQPTETNQEAADALLSAASSVVPLSDALKDLTFAKYTVLASIGRGGMGEVFLARDEDGRRNHRLLALKVLLEEVGRDKELVGMFMDEASIMAQINHPNVLSVSDFGREKGHYYLAMEYLRGRPLVRVMIDAYIEFEGLAPEIIASIGADAARGLHAAHTAMGSNQFPLNVVHRDVSPQNIFVTFDGSAKMIDFGVARASERISRTSAGQLKGKAAYMSPEQVLGQLIDGQSDVFALGVCLWEMMAGRRLFKRDTDYATMESVLKHEIQAPSVFRPGDEALDKIVLGALVRDKNKRVPNAGELCRQLEDYARAKIRGRTEERVANLMTQLYGQIEKDERRLIQQLATRTATQEESRALRELSGISNTNDFGDEITMAGLASDLAELDKSGSWDANPTLIANVDDLLKDTVPLPAESIVPLKQPNEIDDAAIRAQAIQNSVEKLKSEHNEWLERRKLTFAKPNLFPKKNRSLARAAGIFMCAAVVGAGGFIWSQNHSNLPPVESEQPADETLIVADPIEIVAPVQEIITLRDLKERLRSMGLLVREAGEQTRIEDLDRTQPVWVDSDAQVEMSKVQGVEGWLIFSKSRRTPSVSFVGGLTGQKWRAFAASVNDCPATADIKLNGLELTYPDQKVLIEWGSQLRDLRLRRPLFANSMSLVPLGLSWKSNNAARKSMDCQSGWTEKTVNLVRVPAGTYTVIWKGDGVTEEEIIKVGDPEKDADRSR